MGFVDLNLAFPSPGTACGIPRVVTHCVELEEVMAKSTTARAYLDGRGAVRSILGLDAQTAREIVEALDTDREDPFLNPWRRGYNAAIRRAYGN
jgi:hypothetical protein